MDSFGIYYLSWTWNGFDLWAFRVLCKLEDKMYCWFDISVFHCSFSFFLPVFVVNSFLNILWNLLECVICHELGELKMKFRCFVHIGFDFFH